MCLNREGRQPIEAPVARAQGVDELARMSAQPVAAIHVLRMVEDPRASTAALAHVIESDPVLSARVMRLANSPYYGLSRKVSSAARAVIMLGFSTVRALAVSAAYGLVAENAELGPAGFWAHSLASAVSTSVVARQLSTPVGDAFSAGLLHDIGSALLHQRDPETYAAVLEEAQRRRVHVVDVEQATFGTTHAQEGAAALEAWRFPPAFVRAVATHHSDPDTVTEVLARVVIAGEALALCLAGDARCDPPDPVHRAECALDALSVVPARLPRLLSAAERELERLARSLEA